MRLPALSGNNTARTFVDSIRNGKSKRYGEYASNWTVVAGDMLSNSLISDLTTLVLNKDKERKARDEALVHLQKATALIAQAKYSEAVGSLLETISKLSEINSVDISSYRLGLDSLLQETGWNWLRTTGL
jgi:hypothetical protein